jgi:hypothetical protein
MDLPSCPPCLHPNWCPPYPAVRAELLRHLERILTERDSTPEAARSSAAIVGPAGSGRTTFALLAARRWADAMRRRGCALPRIARVRIPDCRGTAGVAAALLRHLDPGFGARGFPIAELLAGFLRRLAREGRGAIAILDDIGPDAPDLTPVRRALLRPKSFLPEGDAGIPPTALLLVGRPMRPSDRRERPGRTDDPPPPAVELRPYTVEELREILTDRLARLGRPEGTGPDARAIAARAWTDVAPATRAIELLREALGDRDPVLRRPTGANPGGSLAWAERRLLRALLATCGERPTELTEIRRREALYARREGAKPLAATTFWRRIVRLEETGLLRRAIRSGGPGGTRSVIRLAGGAPVLLAALTRTENLPVGAHERVVRGSTTGLRAAPAPPAPPAGPQPPWRPPSEAANGPA